MPFDIKTARPIEEVEKKGFDGVSLDLRLSPRRIWADRVAKVAKKIRHKFVQAGLGAYRQLFATI